MGRLRGKLTYANVMATIAVFIALGGASYAATQLPANSVGTKQLKNAAVTPQKLSTASKAALTGGPGPAGPQGPQGVAGAQGPAGQKGSTGDTGVQGEPGLKGDKGEPGTDGKSVVLGTPTGGECDAGGVTVEVEGSATKKAVCNGAPAPEMLGSGKSESGTWWVSGAGVIGDAITFAPLLPSPPEGAEFLKVGQTNTNCPSFGEATAGHLCVYANSENKVTFSTFEPTGSLRLGTALVMTGSESTSRAFGTWAYRAH